MIGSAVPATATLHTTTSSATPSSPTRPSRIRGLSYLRNYTHNHLHANPSRSEPSIVRPHSTPDRPQSQTNRDPEPPTAVRAGESKTRQPPEGSSIQTGEHGWLPTVQGRSALNRNSPHPTSTSTESAQPEPSVAWMTRSRAASALGPTASSASACQQPRRQSHSGDMAGIDTVAEPSGTRNATAREQIPTIRFIPHVEARAARPSLHFTAITRTLRHAGTVVRVGRYSERDAVMPTNSDLAPVGFKSKVVSRRHCEFWCAGGQWYVKDVKSSSGTFLNHIRLSKPNEESRPFPVNDGDVVQLGIDFKGGEEVIFRCVKIRVECNRGWQKGLNSYNTTAHRHILNNTKGKMKDSDAASTNSSECSICLNPVAPCQALFVAPCSHVWHYKCVRNLINGPNWPNFLCPNCRFMADLEADVEQPEDDLEFEDGSFDDANSASDSREGAALNGAEDTPAVHPQTPTAVHPAHRDDRDTTLSTPLDRFEGSSMTSDPDASLNSPPAHTSTRSASRPVAINPPPSFSNTRTHSHNQTASSDIFPLQSATPTTTTQYALAAGVVQGGDEISGPVTPRNEAGPFLLDGFSERGLAGEVVAEESEPGSEGRGLRGGRRG